MGRKKVALIATMGNPNIRVADPAIMMYEKMAAYLRWEDGGQLIVPAVWAVGDVKSTEYGQKAYELGKGF